MVGWLMCRTGSGSQGSGESSFLYFIETLYVMFLDVVCQMIFFADRRGGTNYRKDEINWRHGNQDAHEEVMRASAALENLQLDRKTRNMTSSWR